MSVNEYEAGTQVRLDAQWSGPLSDVFLKVRGPSSATPTLYKLSLSEITDDGGGFYHKELFVDVAGPWYYVFSDQNGERPIEGTFLVNATETISAGVTDLRDVRVMIPRVRRALDGPAATSALADTSTLSDEQITALIADAIADIILFTGGTNVFGHMLEVVDRDPYYQAPIAWRTDNELSLSEQSVVVSQAAINYFFNQLKDLKVEETIRNEAEEWSYRVSVQLISKQFDLLKEARDKALEEVKAVHSIPETYVSFLAERDACVAGWVEPWLEPMGYQSYDRHGYSRSGWCPS